MIAPFLTLYLVFVGLMLGSFINLASDRLPRGESVVSPRSHCRECNRQLNTIDLLPVVGYFLRRGRCATCQAPIGLAAPIVEALCGLLVLVPVVSLGLWPGAAIGLGLVATFGLVVTGVAVQRREAEPLR